jgi:hypothetical protein
MVYEKDKIRRLIEYKDEIINEQFKNDLEWILGAYNKCFVDKRDYEEDRITVRQFKKKYYDLEDEKDRLKEELISYKRKCVTIQTKYKELLGNYRACCRKLKSMV